MTGWWLALVTFERAEPGEGKLPDWAQGACGWMACRAATEDAIDRVIRADLAKVGLRLLETQESQRLVEFDDASAIDEPLAANLQEIQPGAVTVWGTLHCYVAEGEA